MASSAMNVTVSDRFWEPLRERLVKNTVGYVPIMDNTGAVTTSPGSSAPIVTYVSRQKTGRRLTDEDHQGLIKALLELEADGLIELNIALMETLTFSKQIETVARSTVSPSKTLKISMLILTSEQDYGRGAWKWFNSASS